MNFSTRSINARLYAESHPRQIEQAASRAEALSALLGHLSPDQRQIIVPEVLGLMV